MIDLIEFFTANVQCAASYRFRFTIRSKSRTL